VAALSGEAKGMGCRPGHTILDTVGELQGSAFEGVAKLPHHIIIPAHYAAAAPFINNTAFLNTLLFTLPLLLCTEQSNLKRNKPT